MTMASTGARTATGSSVGGAVQWSDIQDKPDTFPPTLPIPMSGVDGLDDVLEGISNDLTALETGKVEEAPLTGEQFARQSGTWTVVASAVTAGDNVGHVDGADVYLGLSGSRMQFARIVGYGLASAEGTANGVEIDVPDAPADNKTYGRKNGSWQPAAGAAQIADTPPATGDPNTFWWDSNSGAFYIRYADVDSTAWIEITEPGQKGDKGDKGDQGDQGDAG